MSGDPYSSSENSALDAGRTVGAGRFSLTRLIGRGGMGLVWLAQDEELKEEVALKFLAPEIAADEIALDDLRRETRNCRRLTHPNIIRIHDFYSSPGEPAFISMEYVAGQNLTSLRLAQPDRCFTWEFLRPLVGQLCQALDYAHGKKVIHRDLKPSNLMLDAEGSLKLADFGIAATISNSSGRVSLRQATSGTVSYMSPQQMNGDTPNATDDIYALGVTLYELLAGRPPFQGGDLPHQVRNVAAMPLMERLAELNLQSDTPPEVSALITDCLAKNPADRPPSAMDVLARLMGAAPVARPSRASGMKWAAAVVCILICAALAGFWFVKARHRAQSATAFASANDPVPVAVEKLKRAADKGDLTTGLLLGDRAYLGLDGHVDYPEALRRYKAAADEKIPEAYGRMGLLCEAIPGIAGGRDEELRWYREGADLKDPIAMVEWAKAWKDANPDDPPTTQERELSAAALPEIMRRAEAGDPLSQYLAGWICEYAVGVDKDYLKAVQWFLKGAAKGDFSSTKEMGFFFHAGRGVEKDQDEAVKWLRKAAEAGNIDAENDYGYMLRDGVAVQKNHAQAVKWFSKAVAEGSGNAEDRMAYMYEKGWGVPQDLQEAVRRYRRAASLGNGDAQKNLDRLGK